MSNRLNIIIITVVMAILGVMLFGILGFNPYFSDISYEGNPFNNGKVKIEVDKPDLQTLKNNSQIIKNEILYDAWEIKNTGNAKGYIYIRKVLIKQTGGAHTSAEKEAGDLKNNGDLDKYLNSIFFIDYDKNFRLDSKDKVIYKGLLNKIPESFSINLPVDAGESNILIAEMYFADNLSNICQGDTISFDITFEISQKSD
jgi:hypothetical protein